MASAAPDTWALVSRADHPEQCWLRPVVAWAWGSATLQSPTCALLSENFTTAPDRHGRGHRYAGGQLIASKGYGVTTGTREHLDEELEDRRG